MNSYEYDKQRYEHRYNYWKEVGYTMKFTKMQDRLKVEFYNHREKIPCYLEYMEDRIICYGDYSSYIFNDVYCECNPKEVNYHSIDYMLGKADRESINTLDFSYDCAETSLREFYNEYLKEDIERDELDISEDDFINSLTEYCDDRSLARAVDEFLEENRLEVMDLFECYPSGECHSDHAIAQLVMMRLIAEDYDKRVND